MVDNGVASFDQVVSRSYQAMEEGGVVLLPLDVAYALICTESKALERIYELKKRHRKRRSVVLGTKEIFKGITVSKWHDRIQQFTYPVGLIEKVNPGSALCKSLPEHVLFHGKIAVFINMGKVGDAVAAYAFERGKLVFGSSANISDAGNHYQLSDVEEEIRSSVDFQVDLGPTQYQERCPDGKGLSSTMIELDKDVLLRRGLLCERVVQEARAIGLHVPNY